MQNIDLQVTRITQENYHMFDDMIYWRVNRKERSKKEKETNKQKNFEAAYRELAFNGFYVYAAMLENRFVGWITCLYMPKIGRWNSGVIYIDELWTVPFLRRKGIANALMQKALDCQKETGAERIRLYTNLDNIPAQELYKKWGLRIKETAVFMEKD